MTHLLVIEDEKPLREEIVDTLRFEGFEVQSAENGQQGVNIARETKPDLIICDITMPVMDGYEVLMALRDDYTTADVPFIFLTARADRSFVRHGMELGADDYVTKPFTQHELLAAVKSRLDRRSAIDDVYRAEMYRTRHKLANLIVNELKLPLTSLQSVQEMIAQQINHMSEEMLQSLMDSLHTGTERLSHIVDRMVYLTQLETQTLNRESVLLQGKILPIWGIVLSALPLARRFATHNREQDIITEARDRFQMVKSQIDPLKHALAELIAVALDVSDNGNPLHITQSSDQQWTQLRICNLDRATAEPEILQLENLHESFAGWDIFRRIVEIHGGTVTIRSFLPEKLWIEVRLPVTRAIPAFDIDPSIFADEFEPNEV